MLFFWFRLHLLAPQVSQGQTGVWTWHNDNWRTGQNTGEATLTPSNVNSRNFGQICSYGWTANSSHNFGPTQRHNQSNPLRRSRTSVVGLESRVRASADVTCGL